MKCPKCQFENREEATFCRKCASELEVVCPQCGKANPPDSNFCEKCARDLTEPKAERPAADLSFEEKLEKAKQLSFSF